LLHGDFSAGEALQKPIGFVRLERDRRAGWNCLRLRAALDDVAGVIVLKGDRRAASATWIVTVSSTIVFWVMSISASWPCRRRRLTTNRDRRQVASKTMLAVMAFEDHVGSLHITMRSARPETRTIDLCEEPIDLCFSALKILARKFVFSLIWSRGRRANAAHKGALLPS
jgi:hypothetical protein